MNNLEELELRSTIERREAVIEEVIDNFEFDTVRKVMLFLDWRWGRKLESVPSCGKLVSCARDLLRSAADHAACFRSTCSDSTGGLCATAWWNENLGVTSLKLAFEVESRTTELEALEDE